MRVSLYFDTLDVNSLSKQVTKNTSKMNKIAGLVVILALIYCNAERFSSNEFEDFFEEILDVPSIDSFELNTIRNYTFGKRISGDQICENKRIRRLYEVKKNVSLVISFHVRALRLGVITALQLTSNQTTSQGKATIKLGGIGKPYIKLLLEVPQTSFLDMMFTVYAKPTSFVNFIYRKEDEVENETLLEFVDEQFFN